MRNFGAALSSFEPQPWTWRETAGALAAGLLIGSGFFWLIVPPELLDPQYFQWMIVSGDPAQHFLGWHFFRNAPWQWPLGASPYGMAMGSSVVFTDSIPLFALLFKTMAPWLPQKFQYFGWWALLCFILQAVFSWLLACCVTERFAQRLLITLLLAASVIMAHRVVGHFALLGHWLILAALFLNVRTPRHATLAWALLAAVSCLVHAYLSYMVMVLWVASVLQRYRIAEWRQTLPEAIAVMLSLLGTMWMAGYFTVSVRKFSVDTAYGVYAANLNTLWAPGLGSRFLPSWPALTPEMAFEGHAYLGAGGLLLVALAVLVLLFSAPARRAALRQWPLILAVLLLMALAFSHRLVLNDRVLIQLPLPSKLQGALSTVRGSGRFMWVAYYALLFGCAALVARYTRAWLGTVLLLAVVAVQALDLSPAALGLRAHFQKQFVADAKNWQTTLTSPFWEAAAQRYNKVLFVPAQNHTPPFVLFGLYAGDHKMAINSGQFARFDTRKVSAMNETMQAALAAGELDPQALYIFWKSSGEKYSVRIGRQDRVEVIDGYTVLAPGWYGDPGSGQINGQIQWTRDREITLPHAAQ